jgi:myo-inositol 2-dehydrogenase/D-chiro-inositol 1-dehydrogenase
MRIAVLGTGRMAALRVPHLREHAEVILAGGDPARTAEVARRYGARAAGVDEALAASPDGVVVASATDRHAEQLLAAARLGVPVLCEKPIALSVEDTRAVVEALARGGATVQVGFQRRFDPGFAAARSRSVGTPYSMRITARDADPAEEHYIPGSGGIFRDMHVHDFDLARWITGREVATVYATGGVRGFERFARHGDVDTSAISLLMDDGMPVLIDGSRHDPRGYDVRMELLGSGDAIVVGLDERTPLARVGGAPPQSCRGAPPTVEPPSNPWGSFAERFADAFARETDAFVALVRDGGESACPPESALEALRVAVACDISRAEGRPVSMDEVG